MSDRDPLPDQPTPADLAVVPIVDVTEGFAGVTARLALGVDAAGCPLTRAVRADLALFALAHGTSAAERITAQLDSLAREAMAAGASPDEVAAMRGRVRLETRPETVAVQGFPAGFPAGRPDITTARAAGHCPAPHRAGDRAATVSPSSATGQETDDGAQGTRRRG